MSNPTIRKPFSRTRTPCLLTPGRESVTDTSAGNNTDINEIVKRFSRTGQLPEKNPLAQYADVTGLQEDLTELINKQRSAVAEFKEAENAQNQQKQTEIQNQLKELETLKKLQAEQQNSATTTETPAP